MAYLHLKSNTASAEGPQGEAILKWLSSFWRRGGTEVCRNRDEHRQKEGEGVRKEAAMA